MGAEGELAAPLVPPGAFAAEECGRPWGDGAAIVEVCSRRMSFRSCVTALVMSEAIWVLIRVRRSGEKPCSVVLMRQGSEANLRCRHCHYFATADIP
jgi:hypothetical protein